MVAALLGEPFRLSIAEVAELTDRQIVQLYAHPRDDMGRVEPPRTRTYGPDLELSPEEERAHWFAMAEFFGMPREQAEAEWAKRRG